MVNFLFVLKMIIHVSGTVQCLTFTPIGTIDDKNSFECNTNVSLVCQTQNVRDIIILEINNTQLVNCVTQCFVNTPLLGKFIVTHNFDEGTIRLDIPTITNADASNEFICRGDSTSISIKPIIKVFPVKSLTKLIINEMNGTNVIETKAPTSCVLLQYNLTFVWNKTRYSNGKMLEPLSEEGFIIKSTEAAKYSICIPSDHCGGEARSSTLEFTEETSGGVDYYITCTIVINENVTRNTSQTYTIISERKFTLKEENKNVVFLDATKCFSKTGCTIGVAMAISVAIILLVVIIVCAILRKRKSVNYCPDSPTGLKLIGKTETSATLTWMHGLYPEGQNKFWLCYKHLQGETSAFKEIKVNSTTATIKNLQPGCMYQCYVYAMTGNQKPNNSKSLYFTTFGLPDEPRNFRLVDDLLTETTATFKWEPGDYRRYKQTFVITYCLEHDEKHTHEEKVADEIENYCTHTVSGLKEGKQYEFEIWSKNRIGVSNRCTKLLLETKGKPENPSDLIASPNTSTSVLIRWKPGQYRRDIQYFVISYRMASGSSEIKWKTLSYDENREAASEVTQNKHRLHMTRSWTRIQHE